MTTHYWTHNGESFEFTWTEEEGWNIPAWDMHSFVTLEEAKKFVEDYAD